MGVGTVGNSDQAYAVDVAETLADRVGPRRPCSESERDAAEFIAGELTEAGLRARLESFRGPTSFAWALAVPPALSLLGKPRLALVLGLAESDLRLEPFSRLFSRRPSQNVVAEVEPAAAPVRTLVLVSHLDSSRSGLLFHPKVAPHLRKLLPLVSIGMLGQAFGPALPKSVAGWIGRVSRAILALALALLAEREVRGRDVPGANDNASGVGAATALARAFAADPLEHTRVVFLATGCEESGLAGMRAFLEAHKGEWKDPIFLNFDGVGAPATLRYLPREGVSRTYLADPALVRVCQTIAAEHPALGLRAAEKLVGLTYDATAAMARGGRAITLSAQDDTIPNYHTARDVAENLDPQVLVSALEVGRLFAEAVERGDADA